MRVDELPKWQEIKTSVEGIFGVGSVKVNKSGSQAFVTRDKNLLAILKCRANAEILILHLRASLTPNLAGYIAASVMLGGSKVDIDEYFEISDDGDWLFGLEALEYAADNIKEYWFNETNKEEEKELPPTKQTYDKEEDAFYDSKIRKKLFLN